MYCRYNQAQYSLCAMARVGRAGNHSVKFGVPEVTRQAPCRNRQSAYDFPQERSKQETAGRQHSCQDSVSLTRNASWRPVRRVFPPYRRVPFHRTSALSVRSTVIPFCLQTATPHCHCPPWKIQPPLYLFSTNDHARRMVKFNRLHQPEPCLRKHQHPCRSCPTYRRRHPCE